MVNEKKENIILDVIKKHNLKIKELDYYTFEMGKIKDYKKNEVPAKLIIVTSMNPTPVGEGKTTTSIGLTDALNKLNYKTIAALREPSLGPVFGMKGTGTGSNKSMLLPFDKINLHFTGDFHAITTANNLISAVIDNEIYQNSKLEIDSNKIVWKRCIDMNDRSLREIQYKINSEKNCIVTTGFNITAASDLMALFCLARSKKDFEQKINNTIVAFNKNNKPIKISDLEITDAIMNIMNDAFFPNIVRTLENNPVIVHGGPFANIAHGCSSIISLNTAMNLSDYVVTEAGFGSDLGLEKFMNITCVEADITPHVIVLTISLKSIIYNGEYNEENINPKMLNIKQKIINGFKNIEHHIEHCRKYNKPIVIAINHREEDKIENMQLLTRLIEGLNIPYAINDCWAKGSDGALNLAKLVINEIENSNNTKHEALYKQKDLLVKKITNIAKNAYGAKDIEFSAIAKKQLEEFANFKDYYVCISKNPYSLTCDSKILGRPENFLTKIETIEINHAARLIIPITSVVYRMPGLPKVPNAKKFILK